MLNEKTAQNLVSASFLLLIGYDLGIGLPEKFIFVAGIFWVVIVGSLIKLSPELRSPTFTKYTGLLIAAFVIFVSYGYSVGFLTGLTPDFENSYVNLTLLELQTVPAAFFTAAMISVPLAVVYREKLLTLIILASSPMAAFNLNDLAAKDGVAMKLLTAVEILLVVLIIWLGCIVAIKTLKLDSTTG